jgi:SpoVK/Ycf46/Vps4 family AAA+-type ATPase
MNFIAVKGPEVFSKWVGESEQAVRDLFRKARQASPCVIFFDEIDAIAAQRESGDGGVGNRVLTQLLTEMDGVSGSKKIVVIAATNRPHVLDPALIRPGRLDRLVYVGLPDKEARVRILSRGIGKIPHDSSCESDSAVELLAVKTEGFSGAEIVMMLKEAAISCIKSNVGASDDICDTLDALSLENPRNQLLLTWKHLEEALAKIQPRTLPSSLDVFDSFRNSAK